MEDNFEQPQNELFPIEVAKGTDTFVNSVQPLKFPSVKLVKLGAVKPVILVLWKL